MGHRTQKRHSETTKSHTLPSSPTHSSSSSSDFEFTISAAPCNSSAADELFYKGQLLPLHLSTRLSMVRTLLLSSSSTSSSSDTTTTASRDSTASSSSADLLCDSSRPSSATDDEFKHLTNTNNTRKPSRYFSLPKFLWKDQKSPTSGGADAKRVSSSAKELIRKYLKKVKPFYEKLSQKQQKTSPPPPPPPPPPRSANTTMWTMKGYKNQEFNGQNEDIHTRINSHSFSGNLRYPRGRNCFSSCPSSMGSSPSHGRNGSGYGSPQLGRTCSGMYNSDASSMEELQNAIQGAILHCKNSMIQNKTLVSSDI